MALFFEQAGEGPAVVLLHGFCESSKIWAEFVPVLAGDHRVLAIDLPGHGQNPFEGMPDDLAGFGQQVWATLDEAGVADAVLIGHSLGGYVALAMAAQQPSRIRGLSLFHSSALADSDERKAARDKTIEFLAQNGIEKFVYPTFINFFSTQSRSQLAPQIQAYLDLCARTAVQTAMRTTAVMRDRPDQTALLSTATFPIQLVIGKEDVAVPLEASLRQVHLPARSHALILAQIGHNGMIEAPEDTLNALRQFAQTCQKVASA